MPLKGLESSWMWSFLKVKIVLKISYYFTSPDPLLEEREIPFS